MIDGIALCGILHRDRTTARVPVLVVTSERDAATWDRARRAGAKALLGKPDAPETLRGEVERLLTEGETAAGTSLPRDAAGGNRAARARESVRRWPRFPNVRPVKADSARAASLSPFPALHCPSCARGLVHERGYLGGVGRYSEQWDRYRCPACGRFEYRHRTRKLRHLA